jgi:hypothetical protein
MPRTLSPTFLAQLKSSGACSPAIFAVLAFANETLYLWSGIGSITPPGPAYSALSTFPYGQAFSGMGWLGKVSAIPQTTKVQAQNITLALSGIPSELVTDATAQVRITGTATIFLGFIDSTGALIPDPIQLFAGSLDVPTLDDSGTTSTIAITAENPLVHLNEAPNRQFDDLDQQIYVPGDLGFSFVDALPNLPIYWPSPATYSTPFPVSIVISPVGADIPVGGTVTLTAYELMSDGSHAAPGSLVRWSSSNPAVATVTTTGATVTGVSPGICLIMLRVPGIAGSGGGSNPSGESRACCVVIVHS